ncbi:MAG: ABC transporter ATP-binding protein [Anaerohalosphaeraceae bacterium]
MKELIFDLNAIGLFYRKAHLFPWKSNKFWALRDVSFRVFRGETIGVIGRNGAGKSTLLKILAGIISADAGQMSRANVTVTMQSIGAGFDPRLTGRQNIVLNGLLLGSDKKQIFSRMSDIIELAGVGEFIDEPIRYYSAGMRARLGFAIAYYIKTDVVLIDEALATGDYAFQKKAVALIKEKIKGDYTVVLASHSMPLIRELCDRVIQIESGVSLPELSVEETINRYETSQK